MVMGLLAGAGSVGSIPGLGRSPGGGSGDPLSYSFFFSVFHLSNLKRIRKYLVLEGIPEGGRG